MIKEKAYAKINLFLNVINKRFDGFHDLEMVMASINLFDVLSFFPRKDNIINVKTEVPITDKIEDNLVYKIANFIQTEFNMETGVDIIIEKQIPIAAGLAGGSADAAATLRGLNKMWKLGLSLEQLAELGLQFGSDIPFCVHNKLCIAKGRGEQLVFLDTKLNFPILLVNPNIQISTKEVFGRLQEDDIKDHKMGDMTSGIYNRNLELVARELFNSLEDIVFEMEPEVQHLKEQMSSWGAEGVLMSGSGATVFALSKNKKTLKTIHDTIQDNHFKILTKIR
jgi:4-diphosphocytidyl-2-C-methyl-D-erythritol kinase